MHIVIDSETHESIDIETWVYRIGCTPELCRIGKEWWLGTLSRIKYTEIHKIRTDTYTETNQTLFVARSV